LRLVPWIRLAVWGKYGVVRFGEALLPRPMQLDPTEKSVRMAKKKAKKPKGWKAFDELTRKLVEIPKGELDKKVTNGKAERLRRKGRKKK